MGSSRLPGKVLMPIRGYTVLERAIGRLRAAPVVDNVAVLTTRLREDDAIVEEAYRLGVVVYRGSESDVLARFYEASREFQPEVIIRATADNPLIEIGSIDRIVKALREENLDYCMERNLPYGAATEAITVGALAKVHRLAQEVPHREHVTLYIKEHPECFCTSLPAAPEAFRYPQIRLTIDTPEDFIFMDQLIRRMPETRHPLPLSDYLPFCLKNLHEGECKALA
ncbi:MAG: NTP transferase domain-containing protein [Acidobacteria bacterium]|nr:NTP transferase domain-containing protein [Acidobacteriota bacterium]